MKLNRDQLCQLYLNQLYQGFQPYSLAEGYRKRDLAATQGEILPDSLDRLLSVLSLSEQDIFYDLGSGTGRVTAQVFLKTPVREACGIEFIPALYQQSLRIAQHIEKDLPEFYEKERRLRFMQGNFLTTPLGKASVVLMNSVCFSQRTLAQISGILESNTGLHSLLTLRPLPGLQKLRFIKTISTECSWDTALCYLYQR